MASKLDTIMRGRVWKFGDSIDTNQLSGVPNAKTLDDIAVRCLVGLRPEFPSQVKPGDILVAGRNFGAGSSRQTAVEVLMHLGIQAVVAESVARIYYRTSLALGFPVIVAPGIGQFVEDQQELEIDYETGVIKNLSTGAEVTFKKYAPSVERVFEVGGLANLIKQRLAEQGITP
jgi:3-isopropylmalate/(R)-2-methylmalate dehydratase small subunit